MSELSYNIAIIGCGPKGLYSLDALTEQIKLASHIKFNVVIFEPSSQLGAGQVYNSEQPHFLLMNFPSDKINAWRITNNTKLSFSSWVSKHHPLMSQYNTYHPRAVVGQYLNECFNKVIESAPDNVTIKHFPYIVREISRSNKQWLVQWNNGEYIFDDVLVATGHQQWQGIGNKVFPVLKQLNKSRYPPNKPVVIKGMGLTAIDAILALTIGRGGLFLSDSNDKNPFPLYCESGLEPDVMTLVSRTSRPMLPKPVYRSAYQSEEFKKQLEKFKFDTQQLTQIVDPHRTLVQPICNAVDVILSLASGSTATWFSNWCKWLPTHSEVEQCLIKAVIECKKNNIRLLPIILGSFWREAYQTIVNAISYDKLDYQAYNDFIVLAAEMERLAFGPPFTSVEMIISLSKAKKLKFSNKLKLITHEAIDAILPKPFEFDTLGPISKLLDSESFNLTPYGTIKVSEDARVYKKNVKIDNLSFIGRMTEISVLGNDTLSRSLHTIPEKWASTTIARASLTSLKYN